MTTKNITNPHDQFFRAAMADKRVAREFLKTHLPKELSILVNLDDLVPQPRSQVNAIRKESTVDVLFKTRIADKEAYIYLLLEHQSTPDPIMSFRILQYTVNTISEHLKTYNTTSIPLIYPLVVYHGKPCRFTTNINDLVDAPRELVDKYFLKPFQLLDLNQIDDEVMKKNIWSGVMEFALKHIFAQDMLPLLHFIAPSLKTIDQINGHDFNGLVLQYILERGELSDKNSFFNLINTTISHETGEKIMSLAEQLRIEGKLEGKFEEKINMAKKMLSEGIDAVFVAKITELSFDQIKKLHLVQV